MDDALPCGCGIANACEQCREIYECMTCSVQPGSPTLCRTCYGRRAVAGPRWMGPRPNFRAERAHPRQASARATEHVVKLKIDLLTAEECERYGVPRPRHGPSAGDFVRSPAHEIIGIVRAVTIDDPVPRVPSYRKTEAHRIIGEIACGAYGVVMPAGWRIDSSSGRTVVSDADGNVLATSAGRRCAVDGCNDAGDRDLGAYGRNIKVCDRHLGEMVPGPWAMPKNGTLIVGEKRYPIEAGDEIIANIVPGKRSVIGSVFVKTPPGYTPFDVGYDDQSGDDL